MPFALRLVPNPSEVDASAQAELAEERALLARARSMEPAALRAVYEKFASGVMRFLRSLLRDPVAAADATQETFARAFRRLSTLQDSDRLRPWLFGIARNVYQEQRRAVRRHATVSVGTLVGEELPERVHLLTPELELLGRETAELLEVALAHLSEDRRTALLLRLDHGLAYQDIAELMGWSLAKVKVEIHRGRTELRAHLTQAEGDAP